jgi:hypothetical protein
MASKSEKTFKYVGVSLLNGNVKARFTNDTATRIKVMQRGGHTNIEFTELPRAMTKAEIEGEGFLQKALDSYKGAAPAAKPAKAAKAVA